LSPGSRTLLGASAAALVAVLAVAAAGCGRRAPAAPRVAASVFPLYDVVRRVAGDRVAVDLILPPGQDTHSFDPRPRDVARLAEAQLVFAVGLGLDDWVARMARDASGGRARVFEVGPLVDPILVPEQVLRLVEDEPGEARPDEEGLPRPIDPHFWLDPVRMQRATDVVVEALQRLHPEEAPLYRSRGDEVKRSLGELHQRTARRAAAWRGRKLVTFHGSLYTFADRYGLEVAAVVEPVPGREPTARYLARVLEAIRRTGPVAIFTEPQLDPRAARVIAQEAGLPLHEIDPVGGGEGLDTYEKLLAQVVSVLDRALS